MRRHFMSAWKALFLFTVLSVCCFASGDPTAVANGLSASAQGIVIPICTLIVFISMAKLGLTGMRAVGASIVAAVVCWALLNIQGLLTWLQARG